MGNLKKSNILKTICYLLVPVLILFIIINAISLTYYSMYTEEFSNYKGYTNTKQFANNYLNNIKRAIRIVENEKEYIEDNTRLMINDAEYKIEVSSGKQSNEYGNTEDIETEKEIYQTDISEIDTSGIQYNFYSIRNYDILIITKQKDIITNVERTSNTNTLEKIKNYIQSKPYYWKYDLKTVETSIEKLNYDEITYDEFDEIEKSDYEIYTSLREENGEIYGYNLLYDTVANTYQYALPSLIILSTILIICVIYLCISIGHKKGEDKIYTDTLDRVPYETVLTIVGILIAVEVVILEISAKFVVNMGNRIKFDSGLTIAIFMGFVMYATLAILSVTTIRRIKAHTFWKNTLIYHFFNFIFNGLFTNANQTVKLAVQYIGFILISGIIVIIIPQTSIIGILILIGFWYYVFKKILDNTNQISKIRQKIKNMYNGDIDEILYEEEFKGELKQIAKELNDISGGLSNAVNEAMKSERLKTELITNVSHDIKTPLTSIINYVDLLKKEEIENEKVKEYLQILDNKSQRLKKLTEDLVEASKASSRKYTIKHRKVKCKRINETSKRRI